MRQSVYRSPPGRRRRQRFAAVAIAGLLSGSANAATIVVTATTDDVINNGNCTLREAIIAANTNAAVDACAAGAGFDVVTVPAGTYTLTIAGVAENAGATGDLDVTDDMTISGDAAGPTIVDGGALDTVIEIDPNKIGLSVTISGLVIRNGKAPATGSRLEYAGGGVRNFSALTLNDVSVSNNTASIGGGIYSEGLLVMVNGTLQENLAFQSGGGLANQRGTALIERTIIGDNAAVNGSGGGINSAAELQMVDCNIVDNDAKGRGGGINNDGGTVTIDAGVISGNNAGNGGAIFNIAGSTALTNVTLSGNNNVSKGLGGGIYSTVGGSQSTELRLTNVTITDNDGGGLRVNGGAHVDAVLNSIIAGNRDRDCDVFGTTLTSLGHNLDGDGSCISSGTNGDITSAEPGLGPLQDNGGLNKTHALLSASPAIDAGASQGCPVDDQRRVARPQDGDSDGTPVCDIGAFETVAVRIFENDFE